MSLGSFSNTVSQYKRSDQIIGENLILKVYDLDDCTESEYTTARQQSHIVKNKKRGQVWDDEEEVFEKDDFEDYSQTISNYLNSIENQQQEQQQQQHVTEFSFVNPWNREPLQSLNSLDLDEYRYYRSTG